SVFPGGVETHPLELEFKQSSLTHAWPNSRTLLDPLTLGLTSLHPHALVPSLLSDEGKRIVVPAFFQRGRDALDKTRQTLTTAHRCGPTRRRGFGPRVRSYGRSFGVVNAADKGGSHQPCGVSRSFRSLFSSAASAQHRQRPR